MLKQAGAPLPLGAASLSTGELTAFLLYVSELVTPVVFVLNFNNQLQAGAAALERIDELLAEAPEEGGRTGPPARCAWRGCASLPGERAAALDGFDLRSPPAPPSRWSAPRGRQEHRGEAARAAL